MSSMYSIDDPSQPEIKILYNNVDIESSEEPPMSEWSSLNFELPEANVKRLQYDQGQYDPGSGEICTKYITLSASSVLRHPYYNYPGILDPGIEDALLLPEPKIKYPDDGQKLYISLCNESNLCPIQLFYSQLLRDNINLSYYGIHPMAFRLIALSLKHNRFVTVLDLTDNWISLDGCFHLGEMLVENITLKVLKLHGCNIGSEGARRLFANLHLNRSLKKLDLSKNQLKDAGIEFLARAIFLGSDVEEVILTRNELTGNGALALSEAFETNNKLVRLNLSWNSIISANAIYTLCQRLAESRKIQELDLSWNSLGGLRVGNGLKILLKNPVIKYLNLSNNKLSSIVVKPLQANLQKAVSLVTLDLSNNPFTPNDALNFLYCLRERKVKLKNLLLDNVMVTDEYIEERNSILSYSFRRKTVVTHGYVQKSFVSKGVDMRELILNRIESLCKKSKKKVINFALIVQELYKIDKEPLDMKQFSRELKSLGAQLDDDLLEGLYNLFPGQKTQKAKSIDLKALVDYLERKWPDQKLPSTPPSEPALPPPEPIAAPTEKKVPTPKGNKKK